uniref:SET domain-containing protein n=1 Tax=Kalanchoe fedtschenkoi TaxID=63787 RepID=A0A7N0ZSG1_KALFE
MTRTGNSLKRKTIELWLTQYSIIWKPMRLCKRGHRITLTYEEEEEAQLNDEPERPLKRTRKSQVGHGTSSVGNSDTVANVSALRTIDSENGGPSGNSSSQHTGKKGAPALNVTSHGDELQSVRSVKVSAHTKNQSVSLTLLAERERNITSHPVVENGAQMYANAIKGIQENPNSSPYFKEKGKKTVSQAPVKERNPMRARPSQALRLKEPKVEPGITSSPNANANMPKALALIQPKEEPFVDCATNFASSKVPSPTASRHPDSPSMMDALHDSGSAQKNGELRTPESPCHDGKNNQPNCPTNSVQRPVSGLADAPKVSSVDLESASSPLGEVRISLSCTLLNQTDFHMPSVDAVLKLAEEKNVKTYDINTNFSVKRVIRDVCDLFLELGCKPVESPESNVMHNPSSMKDLSNAKCDNVNSGFVPSQSTGTVNFKVAAPEVHITPPCMGAVNDHKLPADNGLVNSGEETDKAAEINGRGTDSGNNMAMVVADEFTSIYHADVTDGEEGMEISLINEINNVRPPSFKYMPYNVVFENARLDISLARIGNKDCCKACFGDCLASKIPCECASQLDGSFAYTLDGLLKEDFLEESNSIHRNPQKHLQFCSKNCPLLRSGSDELPVICNGHLARKFIKECWKKCGCHKMCGNRIVQRGITYNLQVFMTPDGRGWGLRTLEDLPKGAFVCEYVGEILTLKELRNRYTCNVNSDAYPVLLDAIWGFDKNLKDDRTLCLDGTIYGNIARFINHRCSDSNLIDIPVEVESPDHHYYHIALFTRRKVNASEELTWDYGIDFGRKFNAIKAFQCQCGSKYCRDMKHSIGSIDETS